MSIGEIGELAASVFQDPRSQFFTVNSSNEVAFGLENHGLPQDKIRRRVEEAFRIFHLERLKDRNVYELSSGERQLISILSAWAMDTDIFLLDEPTANLDFAATQQLKEILLALKSRAKRCCSVSTGSIILRIIADEFWVMTDGEIKGKYTATEAKAFSASRDKHFLCARSTLRRSPCRRKSRCRKPRRRCLPSQMSAIHTVGRPEIPSLVSAFPSVSMRSSALWAPNGCGKTTIGKLIAGALPPLRRQDNAFRKVAKSKAACKSKCCSSFRRRSSSSSQAPSCTNCNTAMR